MFDWITGVVQSAGYVGVFVLMFAENLFPPIPSELIMPLAGFTAAQGKLTITGVVAAGSLGTLAGALAWYDIGRRLGIGRIKAFARRHGRWLTLDEDDVDGAALGVRAGRVPGGCRIRAALRADTALDAAGGVAGRFVRIGRRARRRRGPTGGRGGLSLESAGCDQQAGGQQCNPSRAHVISRLKGG